MNEHRCAVCYVAQFQMKSDVPCPNEWWLQWDNSQAVELERATAIYNQTQRTAI